MKSMKKLVLAGLILLASVVVLAGCDTQLEPKPEQTTVNEHVQEKPNTEQSGGSEQPSGTSGENDSVPEVPKYTVTFAKGNNTEDVSDLPADLTVESGTVLTAEQLKTLSHTENYVFVGWYDGETKAVAGTYTVTKNVTLTAQWKQAIKVTKENLNEGLDKAMANPGIILILESDIIVSETIKIESGNVTIDLNGKTLQKESGTVVNVADGATLTILDNGEGGKISGVNNGVENYGTVTVKDGIISGSGEGSIVVLNRDTGMLTVEGGEISGGRCGVENHGTVTVKDGIISGSGAGSIGVFNGKTGMLTVEEGEISGVYFGVNNDGSLTVEGGSISGVDYGVFNGGTLNLSGAPKITTSENGSDFYLTSPITIVGALTGDGIYYSVKWWGDTPDGTKIVVGGEQVTLTADIEQKFTFKDIKVEFDKSTKALVVKN